MKHQLLALSVVSVALLAACGKKETPAPAAAPAAAAPAGPLVVKIGHVGPTDRKSTRLNSSHQ